MQSKLIQDLENLLQDLKSKRYKVSKELSDIDTQIIGIRLDLDKAKEQERKLQEQERSKERLS